MLKDYLCHIANTLNGYQQPFYAPWDDLLCRLLDEGEIVKLTDYTLSIRFDGRLYGIWIRNHWYSFAHLYAVNEERIAEEAQFRPRFKTMRRLYALICTLKAQQRRHQCQVICFQSAKTTNATDPLKDINAGWLQRIPCEERSDDQQ